MPAGLDHQAFIRKAEIIVVADNDVVQHLDSHELSGGGQFAGKFLSSGLGAILALG